MLNSKSFCVAFLFVFLSGSVGLTQEGNSRLIDEWETAKKVYFARVEQSIKEVTNQLDQLEKSIREAGDLQELRKLKDERSSFAESGTLPTKVSRASYDSLRKTASEDLTKTKKSLILRLLEAKEDDLAQRIDMEFQELSDVLMSDILARWNTARMQHEEEVESAKSLILVQLAKKEDQARENAAPSVVEEIKTSRQLFLEKGVIPRGISPAAYEAQLAKANEKLEQVNKALVRTLLIAKRDDKAKEVSQLLDKSTAGPAKAGQTSSPQQRRVWDNQTYSTKISQQNGDNWVEVRYSGKLERKVRKVAETDQYIEILLLDRQHLMRLYKDHADIYINGKWGWVANGKWVD
ncbi:hypothetical protein VN12_22805 [Pirellula sp. SH-Sr6A]|uniref:hypothetical protein n=1 Tax=Pirellula sp. SH-Sr6A TaxID=1632865 RepID=UPI00078D1EAE|nr:hypothetical protein [Pirellula sp. SH-Sr6A]AMV34975.1 hypothetical protein VN12_22805 [Pirellula sp. SH-Sr6A]